MNGKKLSLYERLPEIYRIKDEEQEGQLKEYLGLVEYVFESIHENIESLYDDLFIETCDDWVIPYIADLLGTSHLSGQPWTLRADVADTIAMRRRKGTLGAIEQLTYDLTQWGVHCVELREYLVWNQHLNHQRPDAGGKSPYAEKPVINKEEIPILRTRAIRGGTVTLRDPALLSLLGGPFDPFAHTADTRPPDFGNIRYNLPNLAVFLWRLKDYRVILSRQKKKLQAEGVIQKAPNLVVVRIDVHPLGDRVVLFNTHRLDLERDRKLKEIKGLTRLDETPGPINRVRLSQGTAGGNPAEYVDIGMYSNAPSGDISELSDVGLQLYFPDDAFAKQALKDWKIRGENLCNWEECLNPTLSDREIAIDPVLGRIAIGVADLNEGKALNENLRLTYTYGEVGPVGAHPVSRPDPPEEYMGEKYETDEINLNSNSSYDLDDALVGPGMSNSKPDIIVIKDSLVHDLDPGAMGLDIENGKPDFRLKRSLIIRAESGQRPIICLSRPLRFRPDDVEEAGKIMVRLEGLYITRADGFPDDAPLIERAAVNRLEITGCTLDPYRKYKNNGNIIKECYNFNKKIMPSIILQEPYGFQDGEEEEEFDQTPEIRIERTITGPLLIDPGYTLSLKDSIIDAGSGVNVDPAKADFAVTGATGEAKDAWGPETEVNGITVFGRMRVESIKGKGGIWVHALQTRDDQKGCIKFSYFSCKGYDRLPQHHGCVSGKKARLVFTSEAFGNPAYGQLAHSSDFRIREMGPGNDSMGAFGFLMEAHKWRNIGIRYREFMPAGVRLLMIPLT